jgi:hypothetical protein
MVCACYSIKEQANKSNKVMGGCDVHGEEREDRYLCSLTALRLKKAKQRGGRMGDGNTTPSGTRDGKLSVLHANRCIMMGNVSEGQLEQRG